MLLKDIDSANLRALAAIRGNNGSINPLEHRYLGYYEVDLFECPTVLMFTNDDCPRGRDILFARHFEPQSMKLWCRLTRVATGILDVGAHVGVYSLAAAALRDDIKIHAFEPNSYAFSRLRVHKGINRFDNIVEHTVALANQESILHFSWIKKPGTPISSGAGLGERPGETREIEKTVVQGTSLDILEIDQLIGVRPLLKIDVEGAEALVFDGMRKILSLKPDIILETFSQASCDFINELILPLGLNVFHILEREGRLVARKKLFPCNIDSGDFNHLITSRTQDDVAQLLK